MKTGSPNQIAGMNDRCECGHRRSVHTKPATPPRWENREHDACEFCACLQFKLAVRG